MSNSAIKFHFFKNFIQNSSPCALENVNSSLIAKIIYDDSNSILTLVFKKRKNRVVVAYENCPKSIFDHLVYLNSRNESLDQFFNKEIKPHFNCKLLYSYRIAKDIKPLSVE